MNYGILYLAHLAKVDASFLLSVGVHRTK